MGFTNGNLLEMGGIFYVFNKMYQSTYFECGKNKIFLGAQIPLLIYFFTGLCCEKEDFNNQQNFSSQ